MKKLLGWLVLLLYCFNYGASGYLLVADVFDDGVDNSSQNEQSNTAKATSEVQKAKGNLEIDIQFVYPIQNTSELNMSLTVTNSKGEVLEVPLNSEDPTRNSVSYQGDTVDVSVKKLDKAGNSLAGLDKTNSMVYIGNTIYGLEKGTYVVNLSGDGYKPYSVSVTLDDYSKRLTLSNSRGIFEPGDVNGDNLINDTDVDMLISKFGSYDSSCDLNRDGIVNIADLNYVTASISGEKSKEEIVKTSAIIDVTDVELVGEDGSTVVGKVEDLFQEDGSVQVYPKNKDSELSEENYASISVQMDNPVETNELRLEVGEENTPTKMDITIVTESGEEITLHKDYSLGGDTHTFTDKPNENTIVIPLNGQVAVKRIIIKVTDSSSHKLADIGKVDFLNNVYDEIPKPEMEFPTNVRALPGSEMITVTFDNMPNVTGYEILINGGKLENKVYQTTYNELNIEDLDNYTTYKIKVQSVNGEWKSGYGEEIEVVPIPNRLPPSVDMVRLTPVFAGLDIGWKSMKDTVSYNLHYKAEGDSDYTVITGIVGSSYKLRDLKAKTKYYVYLTGNNDLGEGSPSAIVNEVTNDSAPTIYPKYKLLNTSNGIGEITNHVVDVLYKPVQNKDGSMLSDMNNQNKFAIVDDDHLTYWYVNDWEAGVTYYKDYTPVIVLDNEYTLKDFVVTIPDNHYHAYYQAKVYYYDGDTISNSTKHSVNARIVRKVDENNRVYYFVKCDEAIKTSRVQVAVSAYGGGNVKISEVKIYQYDSLEDDVADLFEDDLRVKLANGVTESNLKTLESRANEIDDVSKEEHPFKDVILSDIEYARKILNDESISDDIITVDTSISNQNDGHTGFAMSINDYQPLGVVARPGDKFVVYVGSTGAMPELVFTQYHAEADVWKSSSIALTKGQNVITVPTIGTKDENAERGGSVYVRYPRTASSDVIKVRVSGGQKIPVLDLHDVKEESVKKEKITKYLKELNDYVSKLPILYESGKFNKATSVLNSTEIVTEKGLFSIPATAALDAINDKLSSTSEKEARILETTKAFDEMVEYFYRQKGFSTLEEYETADEKKAHASDRMPTGRVNIRYMQMFDGAFMYAGGLHIGVEYESTKGLLQGKTMGNDFAGYFGWGISHEIGHQINLSKLVRAEVTNNVYALLAQTADDKSLSRLEVSEIYPKIYEKVTSGTQGKPTNVFTALGMYWQLHLAYDNENTFEDTNSIFAKINRDVRSNRLSGTSDELLVMYASDAAGENLIPYFENWGVVVSDKAREYVESKYKDTPSKKIWYLNDKARRYRLSGGSAISDSVKVNASFASEDVVNKNITLSFDVSGESEKILGYEIIRNGEVIGFTEGNTYTDLLGSFNNRAVTYQVVAYDYLLNHTEPYTLKEIKVEYSSSVKKDEFSASSNFMVEGEKIDDEDPEMDYSELQVNYVVDGKDNEFNGNVRVDKNDTGDAYIIIDLNSSLALSGIQIKGVKDSENNINQYEVYVSKDRETWNLAKTGTFEFNEENKHTNLVYFDKEGSTGGNQLWTYKDISYVKVVAVGNKSGISVNEIDLLAPPGDNISLNSEGIGVLKEEYCYDEADESKCLEAGTVIFTGEYRGHPAFNVIKLVNASDGNTIYGGIQLLYAKLPSGTDLAEISSGTWVYAVSASDYAKMVGQKVRVELYRVNDAETLDGERLTSTSLSSIELPAREDLHYIQIGEN